MHYKLETVFSIPTDMIAQRITSTSNSTASKTIEISNTNAHILFVKYWSSKIV